MTDAQFSELLVRIGSNGTDWIGIIEALASILALVTVFAAFYQVRQMKKEMTADHDRSRRQLAVELCVRWVESQEPQTFEVCKFIDQLEKKQIDSILASVSFSVPSSTGVQLTKLFEGFAQAQDCYTTKDSQILITEIGSQQLRYLAIRYLNQLETVFIAWASGICDKPIIEEQFRPILDSRAGRNALTSFREQVGKDHFPHFDAFVKAVQFKAEAAGATRKAVG